MTSHSLQPRTIAPTINLEQELHTGFAAHAIRKKARQLVGHGRLRTDDIEDLEMDLTTALIELFPQFDPKIRCWEVFVTMVVERTAAKLVSTRRSIKRAHRYHVVSLASLVEDEDGVRVPLSTQIGDAHCLALQGVEKLTFEEQIDLSADLADAIRTLPREQREICELLTTNSISQTAKILGISRTYLREKIYMIREHFESCHVDDFLEKNTASSPPKKEV